MRTTSSAASSSAICTCATTAPFFCASPVKSSVRHCPAFQMRRHRQDRARRHDAAAADAGEQRAPGFRALTADAGCGSAAASSSSRACQCGSASGALGGPATVTKLGQNPFRHDRSTLQLVGLMRRLRPSAVSTGSIAMQLDCVGAVAAVLAHRFVDHHALRRLRHLAALAPAALFGRADLVVDQHRHAVILAQFALHLVELGAHVARRAGRQRRWLTADDRLVRDDGNARDALRRDLRGVSAARCSRLRPAGRRSSPPRR